MYDELIRNLRNESKYALPSQTRKALIEAADAIEHMASKLCDWCGVFPAKRRRPWDCEIMWPDAQVPEVYIELSKEET